MMMLEVMGRGNILCYRLVSNGCNIKCYFRRKVDSSGKNQNPTKKKKIAPKKPGLNQMMNNSQSIDGHMTAEEVERHLKSRQSFMELVPLTVPNEMFSNEPSLDSESNELVETSPSNIGEECLSVEY